MSAINNNQRPSNATSIETTAVDKAESSLGDKIINVLNSDAMAATCVGLGGILTLVGLALLFLTAAPSLLPIVGVFAVTFGLFLLLNGALSFFMNACEKSPEQSEQQDDSSIVNPYDEDIQAAVELGDTSEDEQKNTKKNQSHQRLSQPASSPSRASPLYKPATGENGEPSSSNGSGSLKKNN